MSYILEALADSEQARQQLAAVPKYSLLPVVGEELPPHRRWPYALAGALLVNAAVLHFWLRPTLPADMASIKMATAPQVVETPAAPAPVIAPLARSEKPAADTAEITLGEATPPQVQPERVNDRRVARPPLPADAPTRTASANPARSSAPISKPKLAPKLIAKPSGGAAVATEASATPTSIATPTSTPTPIATATPSPIAMPTATPSPTPPIPNSAGGTAELPSALQRELPSLSVAGFIRGEGSSSMVIVNDKLVREGDEVAPGVKLEKILSDSLVFNYKGYRFKP
jgi:general secretion pathway protein B